MWAQLRFWLSLRFWMRMKWKPMRWSIPKREMWFRLMVGVYIELTMVWRWPCCWRRRWKRICSVSIVSYLPHQLNPTLLSTHSHTASKSVIKTITQRRLRSPNESVKVLISLEKPIILTAKSTCVIHSQELVFVNQPQRQSWLSVWPRVS